MGTKETFEKQKDTLQNKKPVKHGLELKVPPMVVFLFFFLLIWAIAVWFPVFRVSIPFHLLISAFLGVIALLTGFRSIILVNRNGTSVHAHKPHETTRLVTEGPYRHTRNPMYLSLSMALIAWAIFWNDLLALMIMPAFYAYMTRFQIVPEERILEEKFGDSYREWAERTPRWL